MKSWEKQDWVVAAALFVLAALTFLPGLNSFGILDPSDGLYMECSREMLERNDFMTPYFNYQPFYEKPILIYWSILAGYKMFGVSEWVARLPSAKSGIFTVLLVFIALRFFLRRRAALLAALVLLATPFFVVVGHLALTDMLLSALLTAAMFCFAMRLNGGKLPILLLGYVALGLGVLCKGPLPVLLLGATVVLYLMLTGGVGQSKEPRYRWWWRQIWHLHPAAGLVIVLAIAAPWYLYECSVTKGEFFQEFFIRQNLGRVAGSVNHQNPWYFYIPFLFGGSLPWCLFFLLAWKQHLWQFKHRLLETKRSRIAVFAACWALVVVVLFGALKTKLATYILPAFPPLAVLMGMCFDRWILLRRLKPLMWLGGALFILLSGSTYFLPKLSHVMGRPSPETSLILVLGALLLFLGFGCFTMLLKWSRPRAAVFELVICSVLGIACLVPMGLHLYDRTKDRPYRELLTEADNAHANLATFWRDSPAASFYLHKRVPLVMNNEDLSAFLATEGKPHYLIVENKPKAIERVKECKEPMKIIDEQPKYCLFSFD